MFRLTVKGLRKTIKSLMVMSEKIQQFPADDLADKLEVHYRYIIRSKYGRMTRIERSVTSRIWTTRNKITIRVWPTAKHASAQDTGTSIFGPHARLRPYRYVPFVGMKKHVAKQIQTRPGDPLGIRTLSGRLLQSTWAFRISKRLERLEQLKEEFEEVKLKLRQRRTARLIRRYYKLKDEITRLEAQTLHDQEILGKALTKLLKNPPKKWFHPRLKWQSEYSFWSQARHLGLTQRGQWYKSNTKSTGARLSPKWKWRKRKPPKDYGTWKGFPGKHFSRDFAERARHIVRNFVHTWLEEVEES